MALHPPMLDGLEYEGKDLVFYVGKANDPTKAQVDPHLNWYSDDIVKLLLIVGTYEWSEEKPALELSRTIFNIDKNVFETGLSVQSEAKLSYSIRHLSGSVENSEILKFTLKP